jgi:hypothetical protein
LKIYEQLEQSLKGRKLTDKDVADFLYSLQYDIIEKLRNITALNEKQQIFYSMQLDTVQRILNFLELPEVERKLIKSNLENLI